MQKDLVSIITPAFNAQRYIAQTIRSVLAQTYENFEMIIVDDCSSDGTRSIVEAYAKTDKRIKLISLQKNGGQALARNKAIENAAGRYIAFLDADDLWKPHKLERQVEFMRQNDLAFTYSSYDLIDEDSQQIGTFKTRSVINRDGLLKTCSVGCLTAIYDTKKLGKMYMQNSFYRQEDFILWLDILKKIPHSIGILEPLAMYRLSKTSLTASKVKSAKFQWKLYRNFEKFGVLKSAYYFMFYAVYGFFKYKLKRPSAQRGKNAL